MCFHALCSDLVKPRLSFRGSKRARRAIPSARRSVRCAIHIYLILFFIQYSEFSVSYSRSATLTRDMLKKKKLREKEAKGFTSLLAG